MVAEKDNLVFKLFYASEGGFCMPRLSCLLSAHEIAAAGLGDNWDAFKRALAALRREQVHQLTDLS